MDEPDIDEDLKHTVSLLADLLDDSAPNFKWGCGTDIHDDIQHEEEEQWEEKPNCQPEVAGTLQNSYPRLFDSIREVELLGIREYADERTTLQMKDVTPVDEAFAEKFDAWDLKLHRHLPDFAQPFLYPDVLKV